MADVSMWQDKNSRRQFAARGQALFHQIRDELDEIHGILAIDLESGEYFLGDTLGAANDAARRKYLDQWLYFVRLDNPEAALPLPVW